MIATSPILTTELSSNTVVYQPRSGSGRTIAAIIRRPGPEQILGHLPGVRPVFDVLVRNDAAAGISAVEIDTGGDTLTLPMRRGLTVVTVRINQILRQDRSLLWLRCQ